ncbi:Mediator of DNA damage checkpoint protein 1 [Bienertia sinuspersici]
MPDSQALNAPPQAQFDGHSFSSTEFRDDESPDTIESKRSSLQRVRLVGVAGDLDKVESSFHPPLEELEHSNVNADACDEQRHVSSQTGCMTALKGNDGCLITAHPDIHVTELNAKGDEISGVNNPCSSNPLAGYVNCIDNSEQLSDDFEAHDCGKIGQSKRNDVSIVYTRKRYRTRNIAVNDMEDEKGSPNKIEGYTGLSHVESQEPEDVSKALLFVDQYVGSNAVLSSPVANSTVKDRSLSTQSEKGAQNFIRLANLRNREKESGVFEWNDSDKQSGLSCNCGQLSFTNKKNDQTYVQRSKSSSVIPKKIGNPSVLWKERTKKLNDLSQTDATNCTNAQMTEQMCETKAKEDSKVLDEEVNDESIVMQFETNSIQEESEHAYDVGIDTQMAAEAIQALSYATSMDCSEVDADKRRHKMLNESLEGSLKRIISENWTFPKKVRSVSRGAMSRHKESRRFFIYGNHNSEIHSSKSKAKKTKRRAGQKMDGSSSDLSSIVDFTRKRKVNGAKDAFDRSKENLRPVLNEQLSPCKIKFLGRHSVNELMANGVVHDDDSSAKKTIFSEHLSANIVALQLDREDKNGVPSMDDGKRKANAIPQFNKNPISKDAASPRNLTGSHCDQHAKKKASPSALTRELVRLGFGEAMPDLTSTESRRRKTMADIHVLLSKNLDKHTHNQQEKIMKRLDKFARTRNMLEFIALGKPVVTHMWLESCQQAGCYIDETSYILRDLKKEQELGFRLPFSLDRARKHPLLEGYKAIITPNAKPGQDLLASLVKIVHGQKVMP